MNPKSPTLSEILEELTDYVIQVNDNTPEARHVLSGRVKMAREKAEAAIKDLLPEKIEELLYKITVDLYELADVDKASIDDIWKIHKKYLDMLAMVMDKEAI